MVFWGACVTCSESRFIDVFRNPRPMDRRARRWFGTFAVFVAFKLRNRPSAARSLLHGYIHECNLLRVHPMENLKGMRCRRHTCASKERRCAVASMATGCCSSSSECSK